MNVIEKFHPEGDMVRFAVKLPRTKIVLLNWTIDAYEGLGFVRTDDASRGRASVFSPSCMHVVMRKVLMSLKVEGIIEEIEIEEVPSFEGN